MALTGQLVSTEVDESEEDEVRAGRATERDSNQVMLDGLTKELADAWRATGADDEHRTSLDVLRTKAGFKKAAKRSVTVTADDKSEVKRMIRRACDLHKVTPIFAADRTNEDGTIRVKWTVGLFTPRKRKAAATTETTENAVSPAVSPNGEADGTQGTDNTGPTPDGTGTPDAENPPEGADATAGRSWGRKDRR
jgi:hypothetical protein